MAKTSTKNRDSEDTRQARTLPVALGDALSERYLAYALSTIMARSLPDVRDGLKPVQRRLLYAMRALKLDPQSGYKKCARVVGDVIGKYHPHGDTAIYDALVRLAQEFSQRYPLVDGQGNFGNVDGDNPAAMRYTEARLTAVAELILQDLDAGTVDFLPTYDGEHEEPEVMPAAFPNLLANGALGIAVGMACAVPPHNIGELSAALDALIDAPNLSDEALVELVAGPDFPTGGVLVESRATILAAYASGRGSFRLRARWEKEALKGGGYQIVVSEIPYQVPKSRLVERLASLVEARSVQLLGEIRDESDEQIRLVIEPKSRNVDANLLMEALFQQSDLETRIALNLNVLDASRTPRVMSLREALQAFLDHRYQVLARRLAARLQKIDARLELLEGYLLVYLNIDEVIRIIREEDEPKSQLMETFTLSDIQAEAVLNMRLRALRRLEEEGLRHEQDTLLKERGEIEDTLASKARRRAALHQEIDAMRRSLEGVADRFGQALLPRRTGIEAAPASVSLNWEDLVEREPITLVLSAKGWLRALKGHGVKAEDIRYKEGDAEAFILPGQTTNRFMLMTKRGRVYTLRGDALPSGRGFGEPLSLMLDLGSDDEVIALWVARQAEQAGQVMLAASSGHGFRANEASLLAETRKGKQILTLLPGAEAVCAQPINAEHDSLALVGDNHKLLIFALDEVPELNRGKGVRLQSYRDGGLSDLQLFSYEAGLSWRWGQNKVRTERDLAAWRGKRAGAGRLAPNGFPKTHRFW